MSALDYSIKDPKKRKELVDQILAQNPNPSKHFLETLSDYMIMAKTKDHDITTKNRQVTLSKRETSYQGLVSKLENGEDGLYHMLGGNDKNIIMTPKVEITQKDFDEIPALKELNDQIKRLQEIEKAATGKRRYLLKQQIIEMSKDQYVIKNSARQPLYAQKLTKSESSIDLSESYYIDKNGDIQSNGLVTLLNPQHVSALLCNYNLLKQKCGTIDTDLTDILNELDKLIDQTLKDDYPFYYDLLWYKVDGVKNADIRAALKEKHGYTYSVEYLSALWRKKIPKLLAEQAQENALLWHYTEREIGHWKRCSRCGEVKLAHSRFFSRNKTSSDGWYSVCKKCRNKKKK